MGRRPGPREALTRHPCPHPRFRRPQTSLGIAKCPLEAQFPTSLCPKPGNHCVPPQGAERTVWEETPAFTCNKTSANKPRARVGLVSGRALSVDRGESDTLASRALLAPGQLCLCVSSSGGRPFPLGGTSALSTGGEARGTCPAYRPESPQAPPVRTTNFVLLTAADGRRYEVPSLGQSIEGSNVLGRVQ